MADVFISYKSERRAAAEHLAEILDAYGYTVWWDYGLTSGQDFGTQIERELRAAKAVVVLWCSLAVQSEWVREEAALAKRLDKIIPTFIEKIELPLGFSLAQTLDLSEWDGAPQSNRLERLLRDIGQSVGRAPRPNKEGLDRTERAWRRFGAPSLHKFALSNELEMPTRTLPGALFSKEKREAAAPSKNALSSIPEMVRIPPGQFLMGSPSTERSSGNDGREEPEHDVRIDYAFDLGRYPVTVDEFSAFVADTNHDMGNSAYTWDGKDHTNSTRKGWRDPGFAQTGNHPVCCVNWNDAKAYIAWLNTKQGLDERSDAYRLPSEAEWEYACRAKTKTPFSFGPTISTSQANYDGTRTYGLGSKDENRRKTTPVGLFPANAFGLHDMHGNVWEWCEDVWVDNYVGAPNNGSAWLTRNASLRVLRGGSWTDAPQHLRSAYRRSAPPTGRYDCRGFRLARTARGSSS